MLNTGTIEFNIYIDEDIGYIKVNPEQSLDIAMNNLGDKVKILGDTTNIPVDYSINRRLRPSRTKEYILHNNEHANRISYYRDFPISKYWDASSDKLISFSCDQLSMSTREVSNTYVERVPQLTEGDIKIFRLCLDNLRWSQESKLKSTITIEGTQYNLYEKAKEWGIDLLLSSDDEFRNGKIKSIVYEHILKDVRPSGTPSVWDMNLTGQSEYPEGVLNITVWKDVDKDLFVIAVIKDFYQS